ncbi:MAG: multifunctional oxoglutarate decarboxylase/oxoglutarate dehydrogenase thiamine pyrophosphate-binding subunit/dihydrolipoyllysine-residue succinyltransferase subunit [Chloroflexi bacterium]|nr:multifunctional oxoglutarate decarboxylase/oxoglutarate dehydrogenase thiamine pyrophosphate-binding subunit/dihydrolipoyllysine-residue succinyltransferase subunit [Chloroflexota bacterium]
MPSNDPIDALNLLNAGYVADIYEQYRADPTSVDAGWRSLFDSGTAGFEPVSAPAGPTNGSREADAAAAPEKASPPAAPVPAGATPIRGPAARLAQNMVASLGVPTATSFRDVDVATMETRRKELNEQIAPRKVSFTHLIGWAIVRSSIEQRSMTHYYAETDGQAFRVDPGSINLGLAVDVERRDGSRFLVVPVIRGADEMDFRAFHASYEEVVERARTNKLSPDDFIGATITLTNPGTLGTTASVPRLMPSQGTIVATGTIRDVGGARRMTITSTYDHRIIQGAESGAFLRRIDGLLSGADGFYSAAFVAVGARAADVTTDERMPSPAEAAGAPAVETAVATPAGDAHELVKAVAAGMALVKAYRHFGHMAARLDPLGAEPRGDPALDPAPLGLTPENMRSVQAELMRIYVPGETLADALPHLQETYSGTIAYEVEHIGSHEERVWLRRVIESGEHRRPMEAEDQVALLERLISVETLERFLHKAYLGQKRFSIEGLDAMVPMLDVIIGDAADQGARKVMIGMAHRGRLNVLAHVVGVSYEAILAEFEAGRSGGDAAPTAPKGGLDDVKYHLGAEGGYLTADDEEVRVVLSPNPSHLEAVDPVIEGRTRAEQTDRSGAVASVNPASTLPVLIHGDAAFAAQGVVAETLNLARLDGYATGGTVHLIANNQVGFTTGPREGRSTDYSSDLAKGFDTPIIHVNADDAEACLAAARLAMMYRERFGHDVVIDLVGYRRYGHNEGDEPAYSQPDMYARIAEHATVRERYQAQLVAAGTITAEEAKAKVKEAQADLAERQRSVRTGAEESGEGELDRGSEAIPQEATAEPRTAVPLDRLRELNGALSAVPDSFTIHPKLAKPLERRGTALDSDDPAVDWGHAELLAFASLLTEGTPIRLTGQDTVRGTFSQRHAGLWDARTAERHVPLQHLPGQQASFELHNSPLSEYAALGFEYGYAVTAPDALVLWEAQYGDFVNGAEIILDQFLVSGLAKWRLTSRLTLLLPHGYEGSGPEHSSARLERFLALGAEGNIRVVYPTTPAQYFHLLRRQARHADTRPLVLMTPKSLLRLPRAMSRPSELASGAFLSVLDDPRFADDGAAAKVRRVLVCSGKIYYDLTGAPEFEAAADVAIIRAERLYPFPDGDLQAVLDRYAKIESFAWVQEEPRNMGARKFVLPRIRHLVPYKIPLGDISRPERSRPAEGYPAAHHVEQARIVREALTGR